MRVQDFDQDIFFEKIKRRFGDLEGMAHPVDQDHFIPEIIDPATGEILPYGETGELVFTSITSISSSSTYSSISDLAKESSLSNSSIERFFPRVFNILV